MDVFRLTGTLRRDPRIDAWFNDITDPFRLMVRPWFEHMRSCGSSVRELLHDGCPVACAGEAAFGYVNAFSAHGSVGFFNGALLSDPDGILEGGGKRMRHVKLGPGREVDEDALRVLIDAAYRGVLEQAASLRPSR